MSERTGVLGGGWLTPMSPGRPGQPAFHGRAPLLGVQRSQFLSLFLGGCGSSTIPVPVPRGPAQGPQGVGRLQGRPESSFCHPLLPLEEVGGQTSRAGHRSSGTVPATTAGRLTEVWDRASAWLGSGEGPLPLCRQPAAPCALTWWGERQRDSAPSKGQSSRKPQNSPFGGRKLFLEGRPEVYAELTYFVDFT